MQKLWPRSLMTILLIVVLLLLAAASGFGAYYFYSKYKNLEKNPQLVAQNETKDLVDRIGKLMELPKDETPTVATVLDKGKLKDQLFFKNAENGDKVLVYMNAKKAIMFRPSTNKIIEVAPIFTGNQTKVKVALLNGTNIADLNNNAEAKIKDKVANIEITAKDNANKKDYTKTVVVDLSGSHKAEADQIASLLDGEVRSLPDGETKPNADIAVIVAQYAP